MCWGGEVLDDPNILGHNFIFLINQHRADAQMLW